MKMNPEIKAKWVAALRSGEYKQGRSNLRSEDESFCCLGVLCDLYSREFGERWADPSKDADWFSFMNQDNTLPRSLKGWAGLTNAGGDPVTINGVHAELWEHNDDGRTFAEIADAIEAQL